jgi:hypothetical protein
MERKEFLKNACGFGLCACVAAAAFAPGVALAEDKMPATDKPAAPPEDWRIGFAQQRYAKLLAALGPRVEPAVLSSALQEVGRFCARSSNLVDAYAGNPEGFLNNLRARWKADATYDAEHGTVALAFPAMAECPCALVRKGVTPPSVCECSLGWQKHAFEVVFARPVEVELKGSLLRGDSQCSFAIRAATKPA